LKTLEVYSEFKSKVFNLDSTAGGGVGQRQFVRMFNEQIDKFVQNTQAKEDNNYRIENLDVLLELNTPLTVKMVAQEYVSFNKPKDFFLRDSMLAEAERDGARTYLYVEVPKPKQFEFVFMNDFHKPSYDFEHTLARLDKHSVWVYRGPDFTITGLKFTYYRLPAHINLEGYEEADGRPSVTTDTDLPDHLVYKILDMTVLEYFLRANNVNAAKLAAERIQMNQ